MLEQITTNFMIRSLVATLILVNCEVSNAMEALIGSFEWKPASLEGRALLGTHEQPPLMSPAPPRHPKTNYSMVAAIVVLMVLAVGAILCCCYQWEGQLRLQSRARSIGHSDLLDGIRSSPDSLEHSVGIRSMGESPPTVTSFSVTMPGDDIPRFVAWASPRGVIPVALALPEALQSTPADPHQVLEKIAQNSVLAPPSGRLSG